MTRFSQLNRQNLKWAGRTMLIILLVGVTECLFVLFAHKPLPWTITISALVPLLITVFVIIPMLKAENAASPRS